MISGEICAVGILVGYVLWFVWITHELDKAPMVEDKKPGTEDSNNEKKEDSENEQLPKM